jgi:diguanylate cyclase
VSESLPRGRGSRPVRALDFEAFREDVARRYRQGAGRCAVLVVELGEVWRVDGVLGFDATNELLDKVGMALCAALREADRVGHIGRDRFGCLLSDLSSNEHAMLAANKILRALSEAFHVHGQVLFLRACVGIGMGDAGCDSDAELLRRAAKAVADARANHQRIASYDGARDPLALFQFDLQADLKQAIESNDLFLCYQPQISVESGVVVGVEALLRWRHPVKGLIPPDRLIRVAESTGLMADLTEWVLHTALRECAEYRREGIAVGVSINLSAQNLREPDIVAVISQALDLWGVEGQQVVIELTETAVMDDQPQGVGTLQQLKALGVELSMDDFGTGYSSMARLRDLELDELKVDMSFVRNMLNTPVHERIVQSMVGLAHGLGLRVVAEGVEDQPILDRLRAMGCDLAQGYLIARPLPRSEFVAAFSSGKLRSRD